MNKGPTQKHTLVLHLLSSGITPADITSCCTFRPATTAGLTHRGTQLSLLASGARVTWGPWCSRSPLTRDGQTDEGGEATDENI